MGGRPTKKMSSPKLSDRLDVFHAPVISYLLVCKRELCLVYTFELSQNGMITSETFVSIIIFENPG